MQMRTVNGRKIKDDGDTGIQPDIAVQTGLARRIRRADAVCGDLQAWHVHICELARLRVWYSIYPLSRQFVENDDTTQKQQREKSFIQY